jgi:hypothetical protein
VNLYKVVLVGREFFDRKPGKTDEFAITMKCKKNAGVVRVLQ